MRALADENEELRARIAEQEAAHAHQQAEIKGLEDELKAVRLKGHNYLRTITTYGP